MRCLIIALVLLAGCVPQSEIPLTIYRTANWSDETIHRQVDLANRVFASAGVSFTIQGIYDSTIYRAVEEDHERLYVWLACQPWTTILYVDTSEPCGYALKWGAVIGPCTDDWVLAHELGHVLGLPDQYERRDGNLMGSGRDSGPWLDEEQIGIARAKVTR